VANSLFYPLYKLRHGGAVPGVAASQVLPLHAVFLRLEPPGNFRSLENRQGLGD
jgi:hypothetical protein